MKFRLWYPQLDVYDTVRRVATLLVRGGLEAPSLERTAIFDFYLANPPLLHEAHMPADIRQKFNALALPRPEKTFLSYPSPQLLFHKMQPVQTQALHTLLGKGLLEGNDYGAGLVVPSASGARVFSEDLAPLASPLEMATCEFLTMYFLALGEGHILGLRRSTGLRRVII